MGGSELLASVDLIQVETVFFFLLMMRMAAHCWVKISHSSAVSLPFPPQFLIFAVCSFIVGVSGFLIYGFGESYTLLAVEFAVILGLSFLGPTYSISFFIALLFLRPWEVMQSNGVILAFPRLMGLMCIAFWILRCLMIGTLKLAWTRSTIAMLVFTLWLYLSTLVAGNSEGQADFLSNFSRVAIIYFLIVNVIEDAMDYRLLRDCILISAAGLGAIGLYKYFLMADLHGAEANARLQAIGSLENSNDLAAMLIMVLPMAVRPILESKYTPARLMQVFLFSSITITAVWLSQSRGAILAILLMFASYLLFRMKNKKKALLLALLVGTIFVPVRALMTRDQADINESTQSRITYWKAGLNMAYRNPLLGVGYHNYPSSFESYADDIKFEFGQRTAHSTWILALAEAGLPAFLALLALFYYAFRDAFYLRSLQPDLIYSLIGYTVVISFLSHTYILYPYILLALTTAAARVSSNHKQVIASVLALFLFFVPGFAEAKKSPSIATLQAVAGGEKPVGSESPKTFPNLSLSGSRGETVNFLLYLTNTKRCTRISVDADTNSSDEIARWRGVSVRFFEMPQVHTKQGSFPKAYVGTHYDPLVPALGGSICRSGWIWGEAEISSDAPAGMLKGFIRVENGPELPWKLEVWPMVMPSFPTVPAYAEYTSWYGLLGHYGKWHQNEGALAIQYHEEMKRHRIYPLKAAVKRPDFVAGKETLQLLLRDGTPESFEAQAVQNDSMAYIDFPSFDPKWSEEETLKYWRALENSVKENNLSQRAITYFWDEPKPQDFPRLLAELKQIKAAAPSVMPMVTTEYDSRLAPYVKIFTPVMNYFAVPGHAPASSYRSFQAKGGKVWWYISCMSHGCTGPEESNLPDMMIDRPSAWIRSIAWLTRLEKIDAFLYYSVNNFYQYYPKKDPWKTLWDFHGNGEGTLFYPGRPGVYRSITEHKPIPSIRLKLWRESSFDAEYIAMMDALPKKPTWWPSEFKKLVSNTRNWSKNYGEYQELRNKIGAYLATAAK